MSGASCQDQSSIQDDQNSAFNAFLATVQIDTFDLCILNARVFDGVQFMDGGTDLLIHEGIIKFIGDITKDSIAIRQVITPDSTDIVSPGFIDLHAHGNPLKDPEFSNFLSMGVTTICLGQDGTSPNFDNLEEWMDLVEEKKLGVNIAMFVGHGTLRLLSNVLYKKNPLTKDYELMDTLLTSALEAGCFGMTTGLEYSPGKFADSTELNQLARTIGEYDGLLMSHIRNEDDDQLEKSLNELIQLGKFCQVHVSHLKSVYGKGLSRGAEITRLLEDARKDIQITADLYPYLASYTGIGILFPDWSKPPHSYQDVALNQRSALRDFLVQKVNSRNGPSATLFGSGEYKGMTLAQVSEIKGIPFEQVLIDMGPSGASAAYFIMDESLQNRLIQSDLVAVGSDGSPTMYHPRGYGTHAKMIEEIVISKKILTLSEALYKMTSLPASILKLEDRGSLKSGQQADIAIFNPAEVKANATFTNPHDRATGFKYVIVNGQIALEDAGIRRLNGKMLKKEY